MFGASTGSLICGLKVDAECLVASADALVETYVRQVFSEKSIISGSDEMVD